MVYDTGSVFSDPHISRTGNLNARLYVSIIIYDLFIHLPAALSRRSRETEISDE